MDMRVLVLPQLSSMIQTWVALFILYIILRKFLYNPVSNFIEERNAKIKTDIDEARETRSEAISLKEDYENKIALAKAEGQEIIENSRKRGAEIREGIVDEARLEAQALVERSRKDIAREKEKAYEDVKSSAGELAVLIASKLIEEEISTQNQEMLIDKFIEEVGSAKWQN